MRNTSLPVVFGHFADITKHDTTNIADGPTDAIYVGGAGVVAAVREDGTVVNFTAAAGAELHIRAKRVNSTNTTATLMVALYRRKP